MTQTNHLAKISADVLKTGDLVRVYSQSSGGEGAVTVASLGSVINAQSTTPSGIDLEAQYSSPSATGFNVAVSVANTWLILTPDAGYAAGTITLPSATIGQEVLVNCTQAVAALTFTGNGSDTVVGAPTSLAANDFFRLRYDNVLRRWYRVG